VRHDQCRCLRQGGGQPGDDNRKGNLVRDEVQDRGQMSATGREKSKIPTGACIAEEIIRAHAGRRRDVAVSPLRGAWREGTRV